MAEYCPENKRHHGALGRAIPDVIRRSPDSPDERQRSSRYGPVSGEPQASWGETRLDALRRCLQLYPSFPFAHFQMAMVYLARGDLDTAAQVINEGVAVLDMAGAARSRFPASGLHWLAGSIRLLRDDVDGALSDFSRELNREAPALYTAEFSVAALNGRGCALTRAGHTEQAEAAFRQALAANREQAPQIRSSVRSDPASSGPASSVNQQGGAG